MAQKNTLKELKEKGLCRINVFGAGTEAAFTVNELAPVKIRKELGKNQKPLVEFLDHTEGERGRCMLFAKTALLVKTLLTEEDFQAEKSREDEAMKNYELTEDDEQ